jgi:hypothetical protein
MRTSFFSALLFAASVAGVSGANAQGVIVEDDAFVGPPVVGAGPIVVPGDPIVRPNFGPGYYYGPGYYGLGYPAYAGAYGPCYWQHQRFWDGYGWQVRNVRVCG